jgi:hypothetical protein
MSAPRPEPAVLIRLPFEGRPQIRADFLHDGDERRMLSWLENKPELRDLIFRAYEIREAAA